MSYPRTMYLLPEGATCSISLVVQNEAEHHNASVDGWHDDPACGVEPAPVEADPSTDPQDPAGGGFGGSEEGS